MTDTKSVIEKLSELEAELLIVKHYDDIDIIKAGRVKLEQLQERVDEYIEESKVSTAELIKAMDRVDELEAVVASQSVKIFDAEHLVKVIDEQIRLHQIDARSPIADARLDYGDPE